MIIHGLAGGRGDSSKLVKIITITWTVLFFPLRPLPSPLDDNVYNNISERLKLEGETEKMGVCTKERKGVTAEVLRATPCTNSLGGESGEQKHEGCGGRSACWKYAAVLKTELMMMNLTLTKSAPFLTK